MIGLTKKQQLIMDYLLQGLCTKEIAVICKRSIPSIAGLKKEIFKKKNVGSVAELLALTIKELKQENESLMVYKQKWEYLTNKYFKERRG